MFDLYILILLVLSGLCYCLFYFHLRRKMTKELMQDQPISYFTKKRVQRFILLIAFSVGVTFVISLLLLFGIKLRTYIHEFSLKEVLSLIFFGIVWSITTFGEGQYIAGVLIEQYTMSGLKKDPEYSRLKIATKLIHGKISHLFIGVGSMLILFSIALFELSNPSIILDPIYYYLYALCGICFGLIFGIAQIKNLTWRYQIPFFTVIFTFHLLMLLLIPQQLLHLPFNLFFLLYSGTSTAVLLGNLLKKEFF